MRVTPATAATGKTGEPGEATAPVVGAGRRPGPGRAEFIVLLAGMFAIVAFSIDSMLPALPEIAAELTPEAPNHAQLVITSFVLGLGVGTFFTGPLADTLGRRRVILGGAAVYATGALLASGAPTLELLLAARFLQGLGAAGPRIASLALVRDLHAGREMARIVSFMMTVFMLVPAVAPALGALVIAVAGWRGIFVSFVVFVALLSSWLMLRQPETLPPERRRPFRLRPILAATREVLGHPVVRRSLAIQILIFASLFATLSTAQPLLAQAFGVTRSFPAWFALIAACAATASLLNARLVMRFGMARLVREMLVVEVAFSLAMLVATVSGAVTGTAAFALTIAWTTSVFFTMGLTMGNLNALALAPLGHLAGTAASVLSAFATAISVPIAAAIGLAFDGTVRPLVIGVLACMGASALLARRL